MESKANAEGQMLPGKRNLDVTFQGVSRRFGEVKAVDDVTLNVTAGEFMSLVGPSGSGKTTLLMMLAGFEQPSAGSIRVGDRDITAVPPNRRNIGMVFQKYALFPHRSVAENIAFPLRMRGLGKAERAERVARALSMVKLDNYGSRMPAQLSGGQQQRVALARAIVFEPPVILMDEPLGALDRKLRQHMQIEIKELQQRLRATVIYVTHDQEEALHMSDRIAILDKGRLAQIGAPRDLYENPATGFVADFLGDTNFLDGETIGFNGDDADVRVENCVLRGRMPGGAPAQQGQQVRVAVRPEYVTVSPGTGGAGLSGSVERLVFQGSSLMIMIGLAGGLKIRAQVESQSPLARLQPGEAVAVGWAPGQAHLFPAEGSAR